MPATKTAKSLGLTCPMCGEEGAIKIDLNDLESCECGACDNEFSPQEAIEILTRQLERWKACVAWISAAPVE